MMQDLLLLPPLSLLGGGGFTWDEVLLDVNSEGG